MRAAAIQRMADALLRGVGGRSVKLRLPAPAAGGDVTEELGLATPSFQDVAMWPVAFRRVWAKTSEGKATEKELLVSAKTVEGMVGSLGHASASVLFAGAFGVLVDDVLLEIVSVSAAEAMGEVYAYRLVLREPQALTV